MSFVGLATAAAAATVSLESLCGYVLGSKPRRQADSSGGSRVCDGRIRARLGRTGLFHCGCALFCNWFEGVGLWDPVSSMSHLWA